MRNLTKIGKSVSRVVSAGGSANVPVIKVPAYVTKYEEKRKAADEERRLSVMRKVFYRGDTSKPVISCNQKEFNFYLGQIYNKRFPIPLMSKYWMKKTTTGQKFTVNPWDRNPSLPMKLELLPGFTEVDEKSMSFYYSEFHQFNLSQDILNGIKCMGFKYPTPMQALVIPKILKHKNIVCVAETGCGKTMSYVIPLMQSLLTLKNRQKRPGDAPLAIVVAPGRELAEQIAIVAHRLGLSCDVNVKVLIPKGTKHEHLIPYEGGQIDLLVASFGTAYKLARRGVLKLSHLRHLVFDEADTLFDDSFKDEMKIFLRRLLFQETVVQMGPEPVGTQTILVSTTVPSNLDFFFEDGIDDNNFEYAVSPHAHRIMPHIPQKFIKVDSGTRAGIILELLKKDMKKDFPVMVFCNKSICCDWLSNFLRENDVPNVKFHAGLTILDRAEAWNSFENGDINVFCCTDLASRGIDTQKVKHVINFDFPTSMSDYILRAGRTGRVGSNHGHVTSLINTKAGAYVVQDIEMAIRSSKKLDNVDANIKGKINRLFHSH